MHDCSCKWQAIALKAYEGALCGQNKGTPQSRLDKDLRQAFVGGSRGKSYNYVLHARTMLAPPPALNALIYTRPL